MQDYITDRNYDDDGFGSGKIAMAIILNTANVADKQWDYSIRTNYTTEFEQSEASVSCLYGDDDCIFTYAIPTTEVHTQDLLKPLDSVYLYGYTYSGFSTLQLLVDQFILAIHGFDINIMASVGKAYDRISGIRNFKILFCTFKKNIYI